MCTGCNRVLFPGCNPMCPGCNPMHPSCNPICYMFRRSASRRSSWSATTWVRDASPSLPLQPCSHQPVTPRLQPATLRVQPTSRPTPMRTMSWPATAAPATAASSPPSPRPLGAPLTRFAASRRRTSPPIWSQPTDSTPCNLHHVESAVWGSVECHSSLPCLWGATLRAPGCVRYALGTSHRAVQGGPRHGRAAGSKSPSLRLPTPRRTCMVGDRLDTDIALAHAMGSSSLLVFTGVATADDLLTELSPSRASHDERAPLPTHAISHVGHLLELREQN